MNRYAFIFCLIILLCGTDPANAQTYHDIDPGQLLSEVDNEISRRSGYINRRSKEIAALQHNAPASTAPATERLAHLLAVGEAYKAFNNDSAIHYFVSGNDLAIRAGLDSLANVFNLKMIALIPLSGFTDPSIRALNEVDTTGFQRDMIALYHDSARQLYSYLAMLHDRSDAKKDEYSRLSTMHQDRLLELLPESDRTGHGLNLAENMFAHGDLSRSEAVTSELLESLAPDTKEYARAAYLMSEIASRNGHDDQSIGYLAQSVIADIRSATLEVSSLQALGQRMFAAGDIDRAYDYLTTALYSAVESRSEMRIIQSGGALALMEASHEAQLSSSRRRVSVIMAIMGVLLIGLAVTLIILRKEKTRMSAMRDGLEQANKSKEVYISHFLQLCSIYMDKLNQFCKMANRKIAAGKVDDLHKMTQSGKFIEEPSKEFYAVFDDALLHLHPHFVEEVNALLRDDEQIILGEDEKLNTDLRILALMRLGIHDSGKIAELLNYSVNTIYAYRNKLKNKARNRASFDDDVCNID